MVKLTQLERFPRVLNILTDLFKHFGIHTNVEKMVSMAYRPCYIPVRLSDLAYMRQVTVFGSPYQYILWWGWSAQSAVWGWIQGPC